MRSFRELIEAWPPRRDRSSSIGGFALDTGLHYETVRAMRSRDSINPEHWPRVLLAARRRKIDLTADDLLLMWSPRRRRRKQSPRDGAARAGL